MSCNVRRVVNQDCLRLVPTFERIVKSLPKKALACSACGEEVFIHTNVILNHGDALPFDKAELVGCDATLDKVVEAILNEGVRQESDWSQCFKDTES